MESECESVERLVDQEVEHDYSAQDVQLDADLLKQGA